MKKIVFISHGSLEDVRLLKISKYLYDKGYILEFIGWNRSGDGPKEYKYFERISYIMYKGANSKFSLFFSYIFFVIKAFTHLNKKIRKDSNNKTIFYSINFLSTIAVYFNSLIYGDLKYIYDIYDEFSISYKFPNVIKKVIADFDFKLRRKSLKVIHVEKNRVSEKDDNYMIIRNSPFDFYNGNFTESSKKNCFAVTGWLNNTRGLSSIYQFAKNREDYQFIIAGKIKDSNTLKDLTSLNNVVFYDFMPQEQLFNIIKSCCGIFSLYDPSIEINRLAASNKLYDAMMLGIPVIVNNEIEAARFVNENKIGFTVDYSYNSTWNKLTDINMNKVKELGINGRNLYINRYEFKAQLDKTLLPFIESIYN